MVLLIDANVLLDVLMNREEFINDSSLIWILCETQKAMGFVSTLTFANMMYIMRKELAPNQIELVYKELCLIIEIADFDVSILEQVIQSATAQKLKIEISRKH